jgi:heme-degrading monooxygenase HmoA
MTVCFREANMIAVIFEVWPADGRKPAYLDHAARLRHELEHMDGFISVERFQSLTDPDKLVSLSFWRDEAAVARWRDHMGHREAQTAGRGGIFRDYRLRVAAVVRDYGMIEREQAPTGSPSVHDARSR